MPGGKFRIISLDENKIISFPQEKSISPTALLDFELVANFEDNDYQVKVSAGEGGEVEAVSSTFNNNDIVNLMHRHEHYQFVRWEGSDSVENKNSPTTTVKISEPADIRAIFTPILYPLTITSNPSNTAVFTTSGNKFEFAYGEVVEIKALPKQGLNF